MIFVFSLPSDHNFSGPASFQSETVLKSSLSNITFLPRRSCNTHGLNFTMVIQSNIPKKTMGLCHLLVVYFRLSDSSAKFFLKREYWKILKCIFTILATLSLWMTNLIKYHHLFDAQNTTHSYEPTDKLATA